MCAALKDRAADVLSKQGGIVKVNDLYANGFCPVASRADFLTVADPDFFKYQAEQSNAHRYGDAYADDIVSEQRLLSQTDLLILAFPLWWFSMPAIMKGWVDRVFTAGRFYGGGNVFETAGMRGRKAMLIVTTGGTPDRFTHEGRVGDLDTLLRHISVGMLGWVGFEVLPSFYAHAPARASAGERAAQLDSLGEMLAAMQHGFRRTWPVTPSLI